MATEKKLGVYVCKGCGIAGALDIEKLIAGASSAARVPAEKFKSHDILCSPDGLDMIRNDIRTDGINAVTLVACSQRVKTAEFDFPGSIVTRANIRELVAWSQPPRTEATQALGVDYAVMGIIKTQKGDLPEPNILPDLNNSVMVVGAGVAGLSAALEAAAAGYDVMLIEKENTLGGHAAKEYRQLPSLYPYDKLEAPSVFEQIKLAESNPRIKIFKGATVLSTEGQPGLYEVTLKSKTSPGEEKIKAGAIVLAAGSKPYDAGKLAGLGYGLPNVVTAFQFEELAKKGKINRPLDGREAKKVAFILCAGSRDPEHLPYCSSDCCANALKQARYVRELNKGALAMVFYKDIRTPGQTELFYKSMQDDPGVMLTKADVKGVTLAPGGKLLIEATNTLLGEKIKVEADLVVLATGVVPATAGPQAYLDNLAEAGKKGDADKAKYIEDTPKPEFLLNLTYRQGPELPSLEGGFGFADSNFICFQYETRRTGIYAAGSVRQPMLQQEAAEDGAGAALKAIQAIAHAAGGIAVHPRAWDMTFPDPMMTRCTSCKRCTEECPFGAIDEDAKGTPFYKINRCRRCGTCMGACPERIVSFKDYHVDMIGSMMKSIDVPEEGMRVVCLACENDAYPALDTIGIRRQQQLNPAVRIIPVRCLGSTNLVWVADAFSRGIDGLLLLGCKFGEDYQCHFVKGSELASYRFGKVQETLDRLQLEAERCQMLQVAISDYNKLPEMINNFVKKIEDDLGPNPFKGF